MKTKLNGFAAIATMLVSAPASAATVNLGVLDANVHPFSRSFFRTGNDTGSPLGPYSDIYTFQLLGKSNVIGDLARVQNGRTVLSAALSLTGGSLLSPLEDATLGAFNFNGLDAGDYALEVRGTFSGVSGTANYSGHISARAMNPAPGVPEPASWMAMVLGFSALGAAARYSNGRYRWTITAS